MFKFVARIVLSRLHDYVDSLTQADLDRIVDELNKRLGGNRKIQAASLQVIVMAVKTLLDFVKI